MAMWTSRFPIFPNRSLTQEGPAMRAMLFGVVCWLGVQWFPAPVDASGLRWVRVVRDYTAGILQGDVGTPVVGDIDGDGVPEIVAAFHGPDPSNPGNGTSALIYAWHRDSNPVAGHWPIVIPNYRGYPKMSTLTLGELDGVPGLEIVFASSTPTAFYPSEAVRAYRGDGSLYKTFTFDLLKYGGLQAISPVVADVNGDGFNDVIATGYLSVFMWNGRTGSFLTGWPINVKDRYQETLPPFSDSDGLLSASPAIADLDRDGKHDVIAVSREHVFAWRYDGANLPGWPAALKSVAAVKASPVAGNLRGDGTPLVVVTAPPGESYGYTRIAVFNPDGTQVRGSPYSGILSRRGDLTPALADLDGNGTLEILTPQGTDMESIIGFGFPGISNFPQTAFVTLAEIKNSPVVARLADGTRRVYVAASDGRLYTWDHSGRFPAPVTGVLEALTQLNVSEPLSPTLADLDGDGTLEIIIVSRKVLNHFYGVQTILSTIHVIDLGVQGTPEWATLKGNAKRTGRYRRR